MAADLVEIRFQMNDGSLVVMFGGDEQAARAQAVFDGVALYELPTQN